MRNTKNTFDLSLDIPLYGNINKLNFCNEYELNHYCFAEGDADAEADAELGDLGAEIVAEAEFVGGFGGFGDGSGGDSGGDFGGGDSAEFGDQFGDTDAIAAAQAAAAQAAAQAAAIEQLDEEVDFGKFGFVPGAKVGWVNTTPKGDEFGFHGTPSYEFGYNPDDLTSYEQVLAGMRGQTGHEALSDTALAGLIGTFNAAFGKEATNPGMNFLGYNTGIGRGFAADLVQAPPPGTFNPIGLLGLLGFVGGPIGSLMGFMAGHEAGKTYGLPGVQASTPTTALAGSLFGDYFQDLDAEERAELMNAARVADWGDTYIDNTFKYKEGGLISLAEGGVPDDNRISYVRQNIDTSAGRPVDNWFDRLDKNTQDYLKGAKGYDEWATVHGLETLDMDWDDFTDGGGAGDLDPFDWGKYALEGDEGTDPLTGLGYHRHNVGAIRKYNIIDQLVSDVGVARPDMTFDQWDSLNSGSQGIGKSSIEYRKWLRDKTGFPAGLEESDFREEMSPIPSRNINYRVGSVNEQYNAQEGGGIRDLIESQMTLVDVLNTGQAIPPNMGTQQAQGSMNVAQPTAPNQQNVYTQSTQPQSFYAQPQQVKNYGNLY